MIIYVASRKEIKNCAVQTLMIKLIYLMEMGKCAADSRGHCLPSTGFLGEL